MTGAEVKKMIMDAGIRLWAVAEQLGVSENYFSRRLRGTFDDQEVEKVKAAIEKARANGRGIVKVTKI